MLSVHPPWITAAVPKIFNFLKNNFSFIEASLAYKIDLQFLNTILSYVPGLLSPAWPASEAALEAQENHVGDSSVHSIVSVN